ncbi:MAG: ATP-binding protein, partial [Candidatus Dormibacteria bacterium]
EWGATFSDPRLAAAVVDRITFKALIIDTGDQSYRLRSSRAAKTRPAPKPGAAATNDQHRGAAS